MNERIRKLEQQATETVKCGLNGTATAEVFNRKKFAELIVRECIEQLIKEGDAWEQFSRNPPPGQEINASAALFAAYRLKEDAVNRLEEHFGVE